MYRLLPAAAVAAVALGAVPAFAADLPAYEPAPAVHAPVPSFSWTGGYLGLQAGYGWGDTNYGAVKPKGFVGGAYAGYNVQLDNSPLVLGVDTDFNFSDEKDSPGSVKFRQRWDGATRARVGYAFDRFLVYGAGGLAYADTKVTAPAGSRSKTNLGWTVGGGVEYALTDNLTTRVDYRYVDYGKDAYNIGPVGKASSTENRVMAGVAYKFW
ncbi:MAG: hypothetical protein DI565_04890 [Ancylobacter novellus]|uniref:Outer membrane protein beta-barrel domain-containing protein n=1 Tax=Ancylobacter novellus TaxID=921 RepID=A0A2W5MWJ0_ANCNO|nr:MAG: hypothetical protein DI565_04890 [Ancylobacter novellus]